MHHSPSMDRLRLPLSAALLWSAVGTASAQTFDSGSDGSDGALNLTTPGTIVFNPDDVATFGRRLDVDGDGVYHFTTITIDAGVTVVLRGDLLDGPVYWLAQGDVAIDGVIDLNGAPGQTAGSYANAGARVPAYGGAGGFPGGIGEYGNLPATAGAGPGGGAAASSATDSRPFSAGHVVLGYGNDGGAVYGNDYLVPLVGGSGGGGGRNESGYCGPAAGGGGGGGALLVASKSSIMISGSVSANGGTSGGACAGGDGSGGAISLKAMSVGGAGSITAAGPFGRNPGRIRIESFNYAFTGTQTPVAVRATPYKVFLSTRRPRVRIAFIGGIPVPGHPSANFTAPDVTIPNGSSVPFDIEARNVPPGTNVKLQLISESGPDLNATATLAGTQDLSTATALMDVPPGFSRSYVRVTFAQP